MVREARINGATVGGEIAAADPLRMLEKVMMFFDGLAERDMRQINEELAAKKPDAARIDLLETSAKHNFRDVAVIAKELASYRYPKLSAIKIAQRQDDDISEKTLEQLREETLASCERLGLFETMPVGIANRTAAAGQNGR